MKVLMILHVIPTDSAVCKFFSLFRCTVTGIEIFRIVELLQNTVVSSNLLKADFLCPQFWKVLTKTVRIIRMAF